MTTPTSSSINSSWQMYALHEQAIELTVILGQLFMMMHGHPVQLATAAKLVTEILHEEES